jgi:hypothetical protein
MPDGWEWWSTVVAALVAFQFGVKKEGGRWIWDTFRNPFKPE